MFRKLLVTTAAAAAVLLVAPVSADAARPVEQVDKRIFDAAPDLTAGSVHLDGATAGELGGFMDLTVTAVDGSFPTTFGSTERVKVKAVVTVRPGVVVTVKTRGDIESHIVDGTLTVTAFFDAKDVKFKGCGLKRSKLVGDGLISAADQRTGWLATFSGGFRW